MIPQIAPDAYVRFLGEDYLDGFVAEGGAAVKFAMAPDRKTALETIDLVVERARSSGYQTVLVDATVTRVNLVQQVFFSVADDVPWIPLAARVVGGWATELYGGDASGSTSIAELESRTGIDHAVIRADMQRQLTQKLFKNYKLAKDFRVAMSHLCLAQLEPDASTETTRASLLEWLRGELRLISAVKDKQIYHKIARHSARSMLASTARWTAQAQGAGLCVVMDLNQVAIPSKQLVEDGDLYYTPAAMMDAFEVLRQFIDATDEMEHLMLLVAAPTAFLDEGSKRAFALYPALKNRIWDDVRDKARVNPYAPMVRLSSGSGEMS